MLAIRSLLFRRPHIMLWLVFCQSTPDLDRCGVVGFVEADSLRWSERPEGPAGRGVDGLPGLWVCAEVKAEEYYIIMHGPAHELFAIGDSIGRLDRGREGVHRDELGRVTCQTGGKVASLGRFRPSLFIQ